MTAYLLESLRLFLEALGVIFLIAIVQATARALREIRGRPMGHPAEPREKGDPRPW